MAQTPLPSGHSPLEIPENVTLARLIEIVNQNFRAIPRLFKGDDKNIFVDQTPNTVLIRFGDVSPLEDAGGGGGGGPPGSPASGTYEFTYVNATGCIQDPTDPDCAIPYDVAFRDEISFVGGVLTRTLKNAFVNMHAECKFLRCASSSVSSSGAMFLDRWRLCDTRSSGSVSDDADIFLDPLIFEVAAGTGFVEPVIQLGGGGSCYFWVASVSGETATRPELVEILDGCAAPECHADPCDAACHQDQTSTPTVTNLPAGCGTLYTSFYATVHNFVSFAADPTPTWVWVGSGGPASTLQIYCDGETLYARLLGTNGGITGGSDAAGCYKDVTANVSCDNGQLAGTFTLRFQMTAGAPCTGNNVCGFEHHVTITL